MADRDVFNKLLMRIHSKGQKELNEMERIERVNDGLEYEINNVKKKIDVDKREIQTLIKERGNDKNNKDDDGEHRCVLREIRSGHINSEQ